MKLTTFGDREVTMSNRPRFCFLLLALAMPAHAGDPVPDVDVYLEQIPGSGLFVEATNGAVFDRVTLGGTRSFVQSLEPERLPPGWTLTVDGRRVVLSGPPVGQQPVRFRLRAGERPRSVDWEVSRAGRVLVERENVIPRAAPVWAPKNSLQGVVYLPPEVAPGETIALRGQPGADLPPGGRFVISGVVSEPIDAAKIAAPGDPAPRWAGPPAEGFLLQPPPGLGCDQLAPLAATLFASGADPSSTWKSYYESRSNTAKSAAVVPSWPKDSASPPTAWQVQPLRHETAKNVIRNVRRSYLVAPATTTTSGAGWQIEPAGMPAEGRVLFEGAVSGEATRVSFASTQRLDGCLFTPRPPDLVDLARAQKKDDRETEGKPTPPGIAGPDELHVVELPADLAPGSRLAIRYLDRFGDVWLEVPTSESTVVPPRPTTAEEPPCVRAATTYVQAEDAVCVCGHFPTAASQTAVWIDERSAGVPLSASARSLHFSLPSHARSLGRHVWNGDPAAGFAAPGTAGFCRATTQVIAIRGEVDTATLLRGGSTPMRLTVTGTEDRLSIRIRNLTPTILRIDGGDDQSIETSGGSLNQAVRTVHGLGPGTFNVEWKLEAEPCPCGVP